jgi:hypothetical protein
MAETQIEKYMRLLDCTEEQAKDIIATDEIIDKGGRTPYDLDPEKEKMAKKFANVTSHKKPTAYKFTQRERKADVEKEEIIAKIAEFMQNNTEIAFENVEITNKSKLIAFTIGENRFEFDLKRKRK